MNKIVEKIWLEEVQVQVQVHLFTLIQLQYNAP